MEFEPNWEKWRRMDAAQLWEFVALIARCDPDRLVIDAPFMSKLIFHTGGPRFREFLQIAESGVIAGTLRCQGLESRWPEQSTVLMSEFLRWAKSKELPIPPELQPLAEKGSTSSSPEASGTIDGMEEMMAFIKELGGPAFGTNEKGAREFLYEAGIMERGANLTRRRLTWDGEEIKPKLITAIERWRQVATK